MLSSENHSSLKILFADEVSEVRLVYSRLLSKAGYTVEVAETFEQTIERAATFHPDLSILGGRFSAGSGTELAKRLLNQKESRHTQVVIHAERQRIADATFPAGVIDVIYKDDPVDIFLMRITSIQRYIRLQNAYREAISAQAQHQFAAFQEGIGEMSANILHNVGNTIQGMRSSYEELQQQMEGLKKIQQLYAELIERQHGAQQQSDDSVLKQMEQTLVKAGYDLPEAMENLLSPAQSCMQGLGKRIEHLTQVIRIQQQGAHAYMQNERFSPRQLVDDLLVLIEEDLQRRDITFKIWKVPRFPEVSLPRNQLLQTLINLIKNSAEAIDEAVAEKVMRPARGEINLEITLGGGQIHFAVWDNGIGIESKNLQQLLKFGFTTKKQGKGFGLHSVGNFVTLCKGEIQVLSEGREHGARVTLSFPIE